MNIKNYDVVIIGSGTAGLSARREVEKITDNYVVIDNGELGTTCARVGCMPSKVLIQVANDYYRRHSYSDVGIEGSANLSIDHVKVMKHVRKLRDRFVGGVLKSMEEWKKDHFIKGKASFVNRDTIKVEESNKVYEIRSKKIIIATGSKPFIPKEWECYKKYFIDTDYFFELDKLPESVAVFGLGVIGMELGQALHRLGVDVVGITRRRSIAGLTDPELQSYATKKFEEEMDLSFSGVNIVGEENNKIIVESGGKEWRVDKVFMTMGRRPQLSSLNIESLGLETDDRGIPKYDMNTMQVHGTSIYIAGDVTADLAILHEASDEGRIAGRNILNNQNEKFERRVPLAVVFSDPNIALIGKSYMDLKNEGIDFEVGEVSFEGQGRSIVMGKNKGLLRIYGDKSSGKILGAELMAPSGEHLAHLISWLISFNATVFDSLSLPFYHPVVEEGLRTALRDLASKIDKNYEFELNTI